MNKMIHPTPARKNLGLLAVMVAFISTILVAGYIHNESIRIRDKQQTMEQKQDLLDAVQKSDKYPLVILDDQGKIIQWNAGMEILTGIGSEEAKEKGMEVVICDPLKLEKHQNGVKKAFADIANKGKVLKIACDITNVQNGLVVPIEVTVRVVETAGKLFAIARVDRESAIHRVGINSYPLLLRSHGT